MSFLPEDRTTALPYALMPLLSSTHSVNNKLLWTQMDGLLLTSMMRITFVQPPERALAPKNPLGVFVKKAEPGPHTRDSDSVSPGKDPGVCTPCF